MKKKSASQSALARRSLSEGGFFKLRILLGILLCFAAITLVLFALGKASGQRTPSGNSQPVVRAEYRSVMKVFTKKTPYRESGLPANQGNFENIGPAEYEPRLQQPAEPVLNGLLN